MAKTVVFALILAVPVLGTWSASSLAVYWNGPVGVAIAAGLLAFPVLPLAWEAFAAWRRRRAERASKKPLPPRILTFGDRLILRTLALDGAFLGIFLVGWPQPIFTALSTRGDWFLEDVAGADDVRAAVLRIADGMEWLYELAHENPYAGEDDDREREDDTPPIAGGALGSGATDAGVGGGAASGSGTTGTQTASWETRADAGAESGSMAAPDAGAGAESGSMAASDAGAGAESGSMAASDAGAGSDTDAAAGSGTGAGTGAERGADSEPGVSGPWRQWPFPEVVHPAVDAIPASEERDLASVAAYFRAEVEDPFERAKAIHDYVATRVAYDVPALTGRRPPQDAATVLRSRTAVCEGYARLFDALGDRAGLEVRYVVGDARRPGDPASGEPHAWNAVRIEGGWYLVDPTWDAGSVDAEGRFSFRYSSMYFLTPPEVFGVDHFPDDRVWQLRERPLTRGEFHRQPTLRPRFYADGFRLAAPDRSQVEVDTDAFEARVTSEGRAFFMADVRGDSIAGGREECEVTGDRTLSIRCPVRDRGTWNVFFFSGPERYGRYWDVGAIQLVRR
jgi:hypothetical protein